MAAMPRCPTRHHKPERRCCGAVPSARANGRCSAGRNRRSNAALHDPRVFLTDTTRCLPRQVNSSAPRLKQQFRFSSATRSCRDASKPISFGSSPRMRASAASRSLLAQLVSIRPARPAPTDGLCGSKEQREVTIGPDPDRRVVPFRFCGGNAFTGAAATVGH